MGAAFAAPGGGIQIVLPPDQAAPDQVGEPINVAWIATGAQAVSALATDQSGSLLAAVVGDFVGVWTLRPDPRTTDVPQYDADRPRIGGTDLIDVDRDAQALAQLIVSTKLEPPLAIGLFGAWGSGKSFVLNRIEAEVKRRTASPPSGYLADVRVVRFNAWHYSETNLWASLVELVLQEILRPKGSNIPAVVAPEVEVADSAATEASREVQSSELLVDEKGRQLLRQSRRARLIRNLWLSLFGAIAVLALLLLLLLITGTARDVWLWTVGLLAVVSTVGLALHQFSGIGRDSWDWVRGIIDWRKRGVEAVHAAEEELHAARRGLAAAQARENVTHQAATRAREMATRTDLGAVLARLSGDSEYRDQLSLVTRTRERFEAIDMAVSKSREQRETLLTPGPDEHVVRDLSTGGEGGITSPVPSGPPPEAEPALPDVLLDRVLIVIDDLDRCPPEKVVHVLEAVHLLFDFEMFVVILAVDTRWLEQSLKIKYRKLLGKAGKASPADYLEKIIQIPLHLVPLDRTRVVSMLYGLTGVSIGTRDADTVETPTSPESVVSESSSPWAALTGQTRRPESGPVPAQSLQISEAEIEAMAEVSPLIGTTPRTVKRFVNTYRLLKARAFDATTFDRRRDGLGDHEVVAFLLALVTGHAGLAARLIEAISTTQGARTLEETVHGLASPVLPATQVASRKVVLAWLTSKRSYADGKAVRFSYWAEEVGRFSFIPPMNLHGTDALEHHGQGGKPLPAAEQLLE